MSKNINENITYMTHNCMTGMFNTQASPIISNAFRRKMYKGTIKELSPKL